MHFALTSPPDRGKSVELRWSHYSTKTPAISRREESLRKYNLYFSFNPPPELKPSGPHYEFNPRKISVPFLPPFILREIVSISYHRSCLFLKVYKFPERERDVRGLDSRQSIICLLFTSQLRIFPILYQLPSFNSSNKSRRIPNGSKGC